MLRAVLEGTMRTTAMIMLIIMAAQFLNFVLAAIGLTDGIGKLIEGLGLGKYGTMVLIVVFYLILGCFMETISMMILTTPVHLPDRDQARLGPDLVGRRADDPDRGRARSRRRSASTSTSCRACAGAAPSTT